MNERLSDYLLGELSPAERVHFEARLSADPELRAEVERLRPVVSRLQTLDPAAWDGGVDPPALHGLGSAPARARRRLELRPLVAAAVAAALLALGVAAGVLLGEGDGGEPGGGRELTLTPVQPLGGGASGTVRFTSSGDEATIHVSGLEPSRDGSFYELWLLNSPDDLVSLGSFAVPASGEIDVSVPVPGDAGSFSAFDVSREPPDGNPAHSSKSVLRAPLAS
jgi:anti-sigma-K factor RskA